MNPTTEVPHGQTSLRHTFLSLALAAAWMLCMRPSHAAVDEPWDSLYARVAQCLSLSDSTPCTALLQEALAHLSNEHSDTAAARKLLELAGLHMRTGHLGTSTLSLYHRSLGRSAQAGDACAEMRSQFGLAYYHRYLQHPDSALIHARRAKSSAEACGDSSVIARAQVYIGSALLGESRYVAALHHFQHAEKLYLALADSSGLGGLYLDMAILYSEMHEKERSRAYTLRALQLFAHTGEQMKYGVALVDYTSDLLDVKQVDSALHYLRIAEPIVRTTNRRALGYLEQNYGSAYYLQGNYSKAITHYLSGLAIAQEQDNSHLILLLHTLLSETYLAMDAAALAYRHAQLALDLSTQYPRGFLHSKSLLAVAKSAHHSGKWQESYRAFTSYIKLTDSLYGDEKQRAVAVLEQRYERAKLAAQVIDEQERNELLLSAQRAATRQNYALGISLLLLILLSYAVWSRQRLRLRKQKDEARIARLEHEKLEQELAHQSRELTGKALHIAQKNELIARLRVSLQRLQQGANSADIQPLLNQLKLERMQEDHWHTFMDQFAELNPDFYKHFSETHPHTTHGERRLAALLRMGLGSKDIAHLLNISEMGIKKARYRLRRKMRLDSDTDLEAEIMRY